MKRESLLFLAGLVVVLMPFLGIPSAWKRIGYIALGALIALVAFQLRRDAYLRSIATAGGERATDAYVESPPREVESGGEGARGRRDRSVARA